MSSSAGILPSKLLINASNLHVGGGLQVATSVIGELTILPVLPSCLVVWASSEVDANLRKLGYDLSRLPDYEVVDSFGLRFLISPFARRLKRFGAVLTIFGPLYIFRFSGVNITGFAQPWIIYPDNEIVRLCSWIERLRIRLKFKVQTFFFQRADKLLVELEHVRDRLVKMHIGKASSIFVIHNCLSSLYMEPKTWQPVILPDRQCDLRLGFVGRNYQHKNTRIFPEVIKYLKQKHGICACLFVTFTIEEWGACDDEFRATVSNVGPLFVSQCPTFYRSMDGVIFPSLLECFSASPLEAMASVRPLFASDRPFNRDVCAEHANYFDPLDPENAAACIAQYFHFKADHPQNADYKLEQARMHALSFSNASVRAKQYLDCLTSGIEI